MTSTSVVRIHRVFQDAVEELERAPGERKAEAAARLNVAMRRLYDFVASVKVPADAGLTDNLASGRDILSCEWELTSP